MNTLNDATAMIFCAGLGTRFKPWTLHHPKALAQVNGKSLLERNIKYLNQYGHSNVVINVHHFANQIVDAVQQNNGWGSHIIISNEEDEVLETGGGLARAASFFKPGSNFITINADILTNLNLTELMEHHTQRKALITLAVSNRNSGRGLIFDKNMQLCGWQNKTTGEIKQPVPAVNTHVMAYSGVAVFKPDYFLHNNLTGKFSLIDSFLNLCSAHAIIGFDHSTDKWVDVGKPESVAVAERLFE